MAGAASATCPACGTTVAAFEPGPAGRPNARCPHCGALERHRFLAHLIERMSPVVATARVVLDVAPQRQIRRQLVDLVGERRYVALDRYEPQRDIDLLADLLQLPFRDAAVDVVLCYHVLEHIPDDGRAMSEVARVLSPGGVAFVQVPHRTWRDTDEDPDASPEERVERFGQADHVRHYGSDFADRLRDHGLRSLVVRPRDLVAPRGIARMGLVADERVWVCRSSAHDVALRRPPWPDDEPRADHPTPRPGRLRQLAGAGKRKVVRGG